MEIDYSRVTFTQLHRLPHFNHRLLRRRARTLFPIVQNIFHLV